METSRPQRFSRRALLRASAGAAGAAAVVAHQGPGTILAARRGAAPAALGTASGGDAAFAALGEQVAALMQELRVPGVAVGVLHDGREYHAGFGVTNLEHPLPVDAGTLFQIGSTTKTVTATALMRLVDRGQADLDATVRTYLPELRLGGEGVAANLTLRHLVTHTGGWWGDFYDDFGNGDDALTEYVAAMDGLPQITPLGAFFGYNNAGWSLAGRVIEAVTGATYEAAVQDLVLGPLGMERSFYFPADVLTYAVAAGHDDAGGDPAVVRPWPVPRSIHPAGGITASTGDLLRYARFHLGDGRAEGGERVLSAAAMTRMQTRLGPGGVAGLDEIDGVGVSWMLRRVGGVRIVEHGGATNGQQSAFALVPDRGFALSVLTNANAGADLGLRLTDWALERYLGLIKPAPPTISVDRARLDGFAGDYPVPLADGVVLRFLVEDGALVGRTLLDGAPMPGDADIPTAFYRADAFVVPSGPLKDIRGEFLRGPDGAVGWFRFGGRVFKRAG